MRKKLNKSAIMNELQGSVFFPARNDTPRPEQSEKPVENKNSASLLANQQISKPVNQQTSKEASKQTSLPTNQQTSKSVKKLATKDKQKIGSYLTSDSWMELQTIATRTRRKDHEVLQEAVDHYLEKLKEKR